MPQLLALAAVGAALWVGYRWLAREAGEMAQSVKRAEEELQRREDARTAAFTEPHGSGGAADGANREAASDVVTGQHDEMKELPRLELDPASGEYRVKKP